MGKLWKYLNELYIEVLKAAQRNKLRQISLNARAISAKIIYIIIFLLGRQHELVSS